ncbi:hypothetical protein AB1Y20_003305 [Prymnesium parvum]|uniref:Apple domain-containing protein n=1 Tax=Prymnesium parvum TaxID=97485 RepID=A0AB34JE65_PRYPA
MNWSDVALTPQYLRRELARGHAPLALPDVGGVTALLHSPEHVDQLTDRQLRSLHGAQVDDLEKNRLSAAAGTRWLASAQECHYRPPRPDAASPAAPADDVAILIVDNRPPLPYEVIGTALRSPEAWGRERVRVSERWTPARGAVSSFQLALVINHVYAQLHGYRFYLENPCPQTFKGINASVWRASLPPHMRARALSPKLAKFVANSDICPALPASHRLGPFPPRGPPWAKLAAIRYVARRHHFVAYLDSDVFVPEAWQPLLPLIELSGLTAGKWLAAAEEYPPQKRRRDFRAGLANSGVLLLAGAPAAGAQVLEALERWIWPSTGHPLYFFSWPFEQNALSTSVFRAYPHAWTLLRPGCPLNSPFGALFRHYVGGTPDRNVYHPAHRDAWLLQAVQCTARNLVSAAARSSEPPQSCTPNEPRLQLDAAGCALEEADILMDTRALSPVVLARVRAPDWKPCCAFCNAEPTCRAWAFAPNWPNGMLNCWLLEGFTGTLPASGRWLARKQVGAPRPLSTFVVPESMISSHGEV